MRQGLVVIFTGPLRIETQVKLIVPSEFEPRLRQRVVPELRSGPSLRQVGRMRGDFITNDSCTNILFIWKAKMFFRGDVAEHGGAVPADLCRSNGTGDVVI